MEKSDFCSCNIIHEDAVNIASQAMLTPEAVSDISIFFKILGDPTRVKIVWALDQQELCVCDIAATLEMSKSAISHQLALLRRHRIVKSKRSGKQVFYSLDDEHITTIIEITKTHVCSPHTC